MSKTVRIGIIGSGFARSTQIPAFQNCADAEIVSIASGKYKNAESAALDFGIPHFTADWRETVERDDVDLVSIVTPPVHHKEMTLAAIAAGKAVLCEKPMAMNAAETREMLDAAHAKGCLALIDHELRFVNGRRRAREAIQNGLIGRVRHAKYRFCNAVRGNTELPWTWWSDLDAGGGALGAIGSHVIDTFHWMLDTRVKSVFCRLHSHIKNRLDPANNELRAVTSDDECLMILGFTDGEITQDATATVSISMVEAGEAQNTVELFGTKGALRVHDGGEVFHTDIHENIWKPVEIDLGGVVPGMREGGWSRGFTAFSQKIVEAVREGRNTVEDAANFEDGHNIQYILDAARESDKTGTVISF